MSTRPAGTVHKSVILEELGEVPLLLLDLVNRALGANERVKYYFTLLQSARSSADQPGVPGTDLSVERQAAGVEDLSLDRVVGASRRAGGGRYRIPQARALLERVEEDLRVMLAPLEAAGQASLPGHQAGEHQARLERLLAQVPKGADDEVSDRVLTLLTSADRDGGDSLHLLVMDLHKRLNRLQAELSRESIEGARVYAVEDADRPLIKAFMRGLNATAPLKFEHPGLGTTATRAGGRLILQNDIGTTDAHVLVVSVEGRGTTLTYTDIHARRARFFQGLLKRFDVHWDDTRSRSSGGLAEGETYYLCVGRFEAKDTPELESYLGLLGSRIVFLIDWNRARKRLAQFVVKRDAVELLRWAAQKDYGHRAFLQLGGERLVHEAIEHARAPIRYGERLDEVLGREPVLEYLRFVLRACAEGLLAGRSERLIRDEVKAELLNYFATADERLLGLVSEHATLIGELAGAVQEGLGVLSVPQAAERTLRRCRGWERRADELVVQVRNLVRKSAGTEIHSRIVEEADDAADSLEEAAFLMTLAPAEGALPPREPLERLAALLVDGARAYVQCVENASLIHHGSAREDVQDFLEAVDRVVTVEHETDEAERRVTASLVKEAPSFRILHLYSQFARSLEEAADALSRSALMLRDHVLWEVMGT